MIHIKRHPGVCVRRPACMAMAVAMMFTTVSASQAGAQKSVELGQPVVAAGGPFVAPIGVTRAGERLDLSPRGVVSLSPALPAIPSMAEGSGPGVDKWKI